MLVTTTKHKRFGYESVATSATGRELGTVWNTSKKEAKHQATALGRMQLQALGMEPENTLHRDGSAPGPAARQLVQVGAIGPVRLSHLVRKFRTATTTSRHA